MARRQNVKVGLVDRLIYAVSPSWALQRHQARAAMAMSGGYVGAGYADRFVHWMPGSGDADADIIRDLKELRGRSRDLVRNSSIASGALETTVGHVVGTGLTMQSRIDYEFLGITEERAAEWQRNAEREFGLWASSTYADVFGEQTFYELQGLAFRSRWESGDCGVVLADMDRQGWPYRLALQIIEADRISNPDGKMDDDRLTAGIERDERGAPRTVHIAARHPGKTYSSQSPNTWTPVPIRGSSGRLNFIHFTRKLRPGQTRGVPELAPVIAILKQLDRYANAEVDAAVNSAVFALFVKMDPDAFQDLFNEEAQNTIINNAKRWDGTVKSGAALNLLPGEEVQSPALGRPNPNFDAFFTAGLRQIGIGLNIPHEVLMKHFQSSYSAARAALLDAWRTFRIRRVELADKLCQPVYAEWLADAVADGRLQAPGFFSDPAVRAAWSGAVWSGDGPGALDPRAEAEAAKTRMEIGLTTLAEEIVAYDGGDWENKHRQQKRERQTRETDGLVQSVNQPQPGAAAPRQQPQPGRAESDAPAAVNVGVHLPPGIELNIPAPVVHVAAPVINLPEQPAPVVHVAPPQVNVEAPHVTVQAPETKVLQMQMPAEPPAAQDQPAVLGWKIVKDKDGTKSIVPIDEADR